MSKGLTVNVCEEELVFRVKEDNSRGFCIEILVVFFFGSDFFIFFLEIF